MACGITTLQVAANPLIAVLGSAAHSHSRLNLAQAFNSLGTFIGPFVGSALILSAGVEAPDAAKMSAAELTAYRQAGAHAVQAPFLGIAVLLMVLATVFWLLRRSPAAPGATRTEVNVPALELMRRRPRLALGVLSIFLYVGAEVAIGSLMINYLMEPRTLALTAAAAGHLVAFYWGGAMVGRMIGSGVMLRVPAGEVLTACALGAAALVAVSGASSGYLAAGAIVAVGLCNSVMFPTIFSLAIEDLGSDTPQGSGLLCMAIVGGAIVPLATGALADQVGLALALLAPAACYIWIAAYGLLARSGRLDRRVVQA
jgi:FHS family L-fucose permease-like MFS transporter